MLEWIGFTSKHSLINYTTNLRDWSPHIVIIMHGINDLYRFIFRPLSSQESHTIDYGHIFYGPAINGALPPTFEKHILNSIFIFSIPLVFLKLE